MLVEHRVRFVVIGGVAGRLMGSPTVTNDLDVCYARDPANIRALARSLTDLQAYLRGAPPELPWCPDAEALLAGDHFTLATRAGNLDVLGSPAGSGGYEPLARAAERMKLADLDVYVCALPDLVRMKRAAGRPKDLIELEILAALEEEIDR